jgi:hypothetical protein
LLHRLSLLLLASLALKFSKPSLGTLALAVSGQVAIAPLW